jgi:O-antigen/teichoic acid export membrane protein
MEDTTYSESSYKTILKTTSLFASVKVVTIVVNLIKNKVVAVLLGTSGLGVLGIFTTTLNLINAVSDLGISKSSVRNISISQATQDIHKVSQTVFVFKNLLYLLSIFSAILTLIFSKQLSYYSFGSYDYFLGFAWLSIAVLLNSIYTGQLAILRGLRQLRALAKASSVGSFMGLFVSFPLFYFYGEKGIVPSLIFSSLVAISLSTFFLNKIKFSYVNYNKKELTLEGMNMIKLGISMMLVSFMVALSGFILRAYINKNSGVENVGLFQAGFTIITGYFGLIFTSITTDYFPRLSAISNDNRKIESELNKQSILVLILLCPLIVLLLFIMPFLINFLFSAQFVDAAEYVNWAIFGVVFQSATLIMEMILLAKNKAKIFITYVFSIQSIILFNYIFFYNNFGIKGLGMAFSLSMFINLFVIILLTNKLFKINFNRMFFKTLGVLIGFTLFSFILKDITLLWLKIVLAIIIFSASFYYSICMLRKVLGIKSILVSIKNIIKK